MDALEGLDYYKKKISLNTKDFNQARKGFKLQMHKFQLYIIFHNLWNSRIYCWPVRSSHPVYTSYCITTSEIIISEIKKLLYIPYSIMVVSKCSLNILRVVRKQISLKMPHSRMPNSNFPRCPSSHDIISSVEFHESLNENTKSISWIPFLDPAIFSM